MSNKAIGLDATPIRQMVNRRPDIDGLRAAAVLPVVLHHAGIPWLPGGFVGVDVFFVISGYLITGIVAGEIRESHFNLARFYLRRARRILPALLLVMGATFLAGLLLLAPSEMRDLGRMIVATSLFSSNIVLWGQSGYFDAAAELKPLLMTWTLGVEEQFYIFWPLVLLLAARVGVPLFFGSAALALLSFALAIWATSSHPSAAFYLLPTRAWELLLGAVLALQRPPSLSNLRPGGRVVRDVLSIVGLALIAAAVLLLDRRSGVPGWAALLPCGGAALLIWAGDKAIVNRLVLASPPMVFVGLVSYSLYLWHWPVLVFARVFAGPEGLPALWTAGGLVLAFGLSVLTWRLVETPFRQSPMRAVPSALARYGAALLTVSLLGYATLLSAGFPGRVQQEFVALPVEPPARWQPTPGCGTPPALPCPANPPIKPTIALWGDSHALALAPGVHQWAGQNKQGLLLLTHNSCPPLVGVDMWFNRKPFPFCREFNDGVLAQLTADPDIELVVVTARWAWYTETTDFVFDRHSAHLTNQDDARLSVGNSRRSFEVALNQTVFRLTAAGKKVLLVGQVPELGRDIASCLTRRELPEVLFTWPTCTVPARLVEQRLQVSNDAISALTRSNGSVRGLLPAEVLCNSAVCSAVQGGQLLYSDDNHVSSVGAAYLAKRMDGVLAGSSRP